MTSNTTPDVQAIAALRERVVTICRHRICAGRENEMNQKEALEASAWLETLRGKEQNVNTAKKLLADHKSSCKHWSVRHQTCPIDGSETICEWCGEEQ